MTAGPLPSLPGYALAHHTVWGEYGFELFLRAHGVTDQIAGEAAAGWGGDRAAVYAKAGDTNPLHAIGLVRLAWDTEADAIEAHDAAVRALDQSTPGGTLVNDELADALARARRHRELRRTPRQRRDDRNRDPGAARRVRDLRQLDRTPLAIHFFATLA